MSKKLVTGMLLVLGAAVAANCGGSSDNPTTTQGGTGPGGAPGDAGQSTSSAGKGSGAVSGGGKSPIGAAGNSGAGPEALGGEGPGLGGGGGGGVIGGASGAGGAADTGGAGGASVCPATIQDFPQVYAEAICRKRVECCNNDTDTCMTAVTTALDKIYPGLAAAQTAGAAEGNCSALEACVAAIDAADCADWPKELGSTYGLAVNEPACLAIVTAKLAPTTQCASTYECVDGYCDTTVDPNVCVKLVADGQTCDNAGNYCNVATSYCDTGDNKCKPRLKNAVACTNAQQCESRVCDTAGTGKCIAPGANQCEYTPQGCSMTRGPVRNNWGWSLLAIGLVLGARARRRAR